MIIDKNDFKDIFKKIRQHHEYGADTVFSLPHCNKNDLHFCTGDDEQLFYYEQPDAYSYQAYSVRALYEVMALIDKKKVPAREWLPEKEPLHKGVLNYSWIDLGSMLEERELVNSLHWQMKMANWHYNYSNDHSERRPGFQGMERIYKNLLLLSKWESGRIAANELWNLYVPQNAVMKPDYLTSKAPVMDERARIFSENQLKRTGFAEAFTSDLQAKMAQGLPEIKHPFAKRYEGDEANATLHLKKSATSDFYFLNKFDLRLRKEGQAGEVRQTFYINHGNAKEREENNLKNRPENKYTLKEAYNLLAGRPVFKNLVNQEGQEYQAWVKLNFRNQQKNGNYELKQYHSNYGFDLAKVLSKHSIRELSNSGYRQSLMDSLQRGNLQKATFFDKDGKEERLYISPNISLGALNVYDGNKQRIPTDTLVDRQYIGKDFSEQLNERMKQKQPSPGDSTNNIVDPGKNQRMKTPSEEEKLSGQKIVPAAQHLTDSSAKQLGKSVAGKNRENIKEKPPTVKKQRHKNKIQ